MKKFENKRVTESGIELRGVSGGLQDAVKVAAVELAQGERCFVLFEAHCDSVRHDPTDKDEPGGDQRRVHILKPETAALIAVDEGMRLLTDHKVALSRLKEAEGQQSLDDVDPDDEALKEAADAL